jgi:hypothetical protein
LRIPRGSTEPGQIVDVEWPADAVPRETREMELVLSLDGGQTFPFRVTEELPAEATRASWRVPALRAARARLALRAGESEEASESESIRAVSDIFEILPDASGSTEALLAVGGERRTREAVALPEHREPAASSLAGEESLAERDGREDPASPTRPQIRVPATRTFANAGEPVPNRPSSGNRLRSFVRSSSPPLRI